MWPHPLTKKHYPNKPSFNGIYFRINLPKAKDEAYVINPDEYKSIETHWIALYVKAYNDAIYFDKYISIYYNKYF